jgi:IS605 OrfB family transposase
MPFATVTLRLRLREPSSHEQRVLLAEFPRAQRAIWNGCLMAMYEPACAESDAAWGEACEAAKAAGLADDEIVAYARKHVRKVKYPSAADYSRAVTAYRRQPGCEALSTAYLPTMSELAQRFWEAQARSFGRTSTGKIAAGQKFGRMRRKRPQDDLSASLCLQTQCGKADYADAEHGGRKALTRELFDPANMRIKVPSVGWLRFRDEGGAWRRYAEPACASRTNRMRIVREGGGYYVCLDVQTDALPGHAQPDSAVGLDMGVTIPVAARDAIGTDVAYGADMVERVTRLERRRLKLQRHAARKFRAAAAAQGYLTETGAIRRGVRVEKSRRYRKTLARTAAVYARIARVRREWQHQVSHTITRDYETVVVEDLKTFSMTRSAAGDDQPGSNVRAKPGLNREILARGWTGLRTALAYKCTLRGGTLVAVDPAYTSQTCSACGTVNSASRAGTEYRCVHCGHADNADFQAAGNILRRGTVAAHAIDIARGGSAAVGAPGEARNTSGASGPIVRPGRITARAPTATGRSAICDTAGVLSSGSGSVDSDKQLLALTVAPAGP